MSSYYEVLVVRRRLVPIEELTRWRALAITSVTVNAFMVIAMLIGGAL